MIPRPTDEEFKAGKRKLPLSPEQVKEDRAQQVAVHFPGEDPTKVVLFCDECRDNNVCIYAFDGYNTDGDCLAEK